MAKNAFNNLVFMFGITFFALIFIGSVYSKYYMNTKINYENALAMATRDSTIVMQELKKEASVNTNYDGYLNKENIVNIDYEQILQRFYKTLFYNIGIYGDEGAEKEFRARIPFKGIVSNDALHISLWNDNWLPPIPFKYFDSGNNKIYFYSLNDYVKYYDIETGETYEGDVSRTLSPVEDFSHVEFKKYVIMETINSSFTEIASTDFNITTMNLGKGVRFTLPHLDYLNYNDNAIEHPGVFAYIDAVEIGIRRKPFRAFSFGGSQMKLKY